MKKTIELSDLTDTFQAVAEGSNGHDYVDLGLSVKWATMNLGAAKISDPGGYYAWGETGKKDDYTWGPISMEAPRTP